MENVFFFLKRQNKRNSRRWWWCEATDDAYWFLLQLPRPKFSWIYGWRPPKTVRRPKRVTDTRSTCKNYEMKPIRKKRNVWNISPSSLDNIIIHILKGIFNIILPFFVFCFFCLVFCFIRNAKGKIYTPACRWCFTRRRPLFLRGGSSNILLSNTKRFLKETPKKKKKKKNDEYANDHNR